MISRMVSKRNEGARYRLMKPGLTTSTFPIMGSLPMCRASTLPISMGDFFNRRADSSANGAE